MNNLPQDPKPEMSRQSKAAHAELERALSMHFDGNKAGALKSLRNALRQDPALADQPLANNLAREITGLPASEALKSVVNDQVNKDLIHSAKAERQETPTMQRQRNMLMVLAVLLVVFIGLCAWMAGSGAFEVYLDAIRITQLQSQKGNLDGYDYYLAVPKGLAPDNGWPMVVVFHGYGGNGEQVLPLAKTFNDAGAVFVAPTLGEYRPNPGNGPLEPVSRILTEIGNQYPIQSRGAILLGHSQGGSFAYRFSVYYPGQVAGVVTAGAPEFDGIYPKRNIPYIFTWGELDGLQQFVLPMVYPIQNQGFNVRTYIVPDVGHELSQYAIDQTLILLEQP